jgi:FkbM family methyltransferase
MVGQWLSIFYYQSPFEGIFKNKLFLFLTNHHRFYINKPLAKMINQLLNMVQRKIARSKLLVEASKKIKNQAEAIIGYSLAQSHFSEINGELKLIEHIMKDDWIIFDVGANQGLWSEMIIQRNNQGNHFFLFEPATNAFAKLIEKFNQSTGIQLINKGVGEQCVSLDFYEYRVANEGSSFVDIGIKEEPEIKTIEVITIDQFCLENSIYHIDYLKIDCEGFDFNVLKGAVNMIKKNQISFIQFEYGKGWQVIGATLTAAYNFLESNGYKVYAIKPHGLAEWDLKSSGEFFHYSNFLAVSKNNLNVIQHYISTS